jgi:hypothetical protein
MQLKISTMRVAYAGTEVTFGIWQGSANTEPTEAGAAAGGFAASHIGPFAKESNTWQTDDMLVLTNLAMP